MAKFQIFRETALPSTLQNDSMYIIAPAAKPNYIEIYVVNSSGQVRRNINQDDIQALITSSIQAQAQVTVVADIPARNALEPNRVEYVYVINATADSTVTSGGATYIYDLAHTSWVKTSEAESMDIQQTWAALQNKPSSTVAQIDAAVGAMHSHSNKTQLDQIGVDTNGNLTYAGSLPHIGWNSTNW